MTHFRNILIATDLVGDVSASLDAGLRLARDDAATVHVLHALELPWLETPTSLMPLGMTQRDYIDGSVKSARDELDRLVADHAANPRIHTHVAVAHSPARTICEHAVEHGCDVIVVGTHKRTGVKRWLMGSVAEMTTRHARCSVLVVPDDAMLRKRPAKRIVAAVDFSESSITALRRAHALATQHQAELAVVHVVDVPAVSTSGFGVPPSSGAPYQHANDDAQQRLDALLREHFGTDEQPEREVALSARVATTICEYGIDHNADLVVTGTVGHTGFDRWLMGSVAEQVVRHAKSSVLVVR